MAAYKPTAVLVKLGEEGLWSRLALDVMEMDRVSLLEALAANRVFSVELRDVPLSKCAVKVCVSASKKGPSTEDEARADASGELEGADTLRDLVKGPVTDRYPYLCIRVTLPTATAARMRNDEERRAAAFSALVVERWPSDVAKLGSTTQSFVGLYDKSGPNTQPGWMTARIMAGLPESATAPVPVSALDPAFGVVLDYAAGKYDFPVAPSLPTTVSEQGESSPLSKLFNSVGALMASASEHCDKERQRNEKLLGCLHPILGIVKAESDSAVHPTVTDGSGFVLTPNGSRVLVTNLELKESPAAGRPELQNLTYYLQHYVPRPSSSGSKSTLVDGIPGDILQAVPLVPALLLDIHGGAALSVRGVVMTGFGVLSEVLASAHLVGRRGSPQHWALVRLLAGVKAGIDSLSQRYQAAPHMLQVPLVRPPIRETPGELLPGRVHLFDGSGDMMLQARAFLSADSGHRLGRWVFEGHVAILPSGGDASAAAVAPDAWRLCLVKLVPAHYGVHAHQSAARASAAPELYGAAHLPGDWWLVAMEWLQSKDGWVGYDASKAGHHAAAWNAWKRGVAACGNVHGDLRPENILVRPTAAVYGSGEGSSGGWEARLVDFDWAGKDGAVRYPLSRNPELPWAPGSTAGGLISSAHDEHVLRLTA